MTQFPANIDLSSLDGSTGFTLSGAAAGDWSGSSVAFAGDVNGDGFGDLIVGANGADSNGINSGASYVVFGKASGFAANLDLSSLDGSNGFTLSGVAASDASGSAVASAGDVNGDGFADLIVGAWAADPAGAFSGTSYVVFGKASGFSANLDLSSLDGGNGFKLNGAGTYDFSGGSVSAGDVNGDGFADLIVGRRFGARVVFGKATGFAPNIDLSSLDGSSGFTIGGVVGGPDVASAGDVNGDGFADIIIGDSNATPHGTRSGASWVVFGKASGFAANIHLSSLDGSNGFKLSGESADDLSGLSVGSAGDVNGDGFADVIVGALYADAPGKKSGASYVVFGKASGFAANLDLSDLDGSNGFKLGGAAKQDQSGVSVASAGDVNGDGFADVIVGARGADPHGRDSGASYVVFGKASGFAANIDLSSLDGSDGFKLSGVAAGDRSGEPVASAGDVNGDGFADLIVGAPSADPHGDQSGTSYVIFGRAPDTAVNRVGTVASQTLAGGKFDDTLSGLGGDDALFGNGGNDALDGGLGDDTLQGGAGEDALRGREGNDVLYGGEGADELFGREGNDRLYGGAGKDGLSGGDGDDIVDGGDGKDTARYASAAAGVMVSLGIGGAQDTGAAGIDTLISIENLVGSAFADGLTGNGKANVLAGNGGNDILTGGEGSDTFQFDTPLVAGEFTTITDFAAGGDKVALASSVFSQAGSLGPLSADAFFIGAAAHDASDRILYNAGSGAVLYDPDGTGAQAATQFATISPGLALSAGDFKIL